jgi:hypothetical protein
MCRTGPFESDGPDTPSTGGQAATYIENPALYLSGIFSWGASRQPAISPSRTGSSAAPAGGGRSDAKARNDAIRQMEEFFGIRATTPFSQRLSPSFPG